VILERSAAAGIFPVTLCLESFTHCLILVCCMLLCNLPRNQLHHGRLRRAAPRLYLNMQMRQCIWILGLSVDVY
jgi:hypothetical protein